MKFSELKECPYCGCDTFYTKAHFSGHVIFYERFDGEAADNTNMYEDLVQATSGNKVYCAACERDIGNRGKNTVVRKATIACELSDE